MLDRSRRLPRRHRRQPRGAGALRPVPPCPAFAAALRGRWAVSHGQPRSGPPAKRAGAGTAPRPAPPRLPGVSSRPLRRSGRRPRAAASPWQRPEGAFRGGLEAGNDGAAGAEAAEPGRSHVSGWRRAARRWGRWRVRLARGRGGSSGTPGRRASVRRFRGAAGPGAPAGRRARRRPGLRPLSFPGAAVSGTSPARPPLSFSPARRRCLGAPFPAAEMAAPLWRAPRAPQPPRERWMRPRPWPRKSTRC